MGHEYTARITLRGTAEEVNRAIGELRSTVQYENINVEIDANELSALIREHGFTFADDGRNTNEYERIGEKFEDRLTSGDDLFTSDQCILGRRRRTTAQQDFTVLLTGTLAQILANDPGRA